MGRRGTRVLMEYVHTFTDRHGKVRYYYRRHGKRTPLPGKPGTPEFMAAYAEASTKVPAIKSRGEVGTFSRLINEYQTSTDFLRLKPSTRAVYRGILERFEKQHGHRLVSQMKRQHVDAIMASMAATPAAANSFLKRLKTLIIFAIGRGLITTDPTYRMKSFKEGEIHTWTEEEVQQFETHWPIGTRQRLAFSLHLFTGQRRSDVCRMTWRDICGDRISVVQQKTGASLTIPLHPDLAGILDGEKREHVIIIATAYGCPFTVAGYGQWINEAIREAGLPERCVAHGLRKAAARRLAEAGCSASEIASVTGHKTLAEVERYTRAADQKKLSEAAIIKQIANKKGKPEHE